MEKNVTNVIIIDNFCFKVSILFFYSLKIHIKNNFRYNIPQIQKNYS